MKVIRQLDRWIILSLLERHVLPLFFQETSLDNLLWFVYQAALMIECYLSTIFCLSIALFTFFYRQYYVL